MKRSCVMLPRPLRTETAAAMRPQSERLVRGEMRYFPTCRGVWMKRSFYGTASPWRRPIRWRQERIVRMRRMNSVRRLVRRVARCGLEATRTKRPPGQSEGLVRDGDQHVISAAWSVLHSSPTLAKTGFYHRHPRRRSPNGPMASKVTVVFKPMQGRAGDAAGNGRGRHSRERACRLSCRRTTSRRPGNAHHFPPAESSEARARSAGWPTAVAAVEAQADVAGTGAAGTTIKLLHAPQA